MVIKNAKYDKLAKEKKYSKRDTSYSSFWLYNREADMNSEAFKDKFVNFYDDKNTLSEFNPAVAKNIISFWSNDGDIVLDPFSGRTRAIVSYAMNRSYVGFEVSKDVVNYMYNRFEDIGILNNQNFNIDIINDDCINVKNYLDGKVDLVFSCFDKETEVLTEDGFKLFKDLKYNDKIATLNGNDQLQYQKPIKIIKQKHDGDMYKLSSKQINLMVTPDHNLYIRDIHKDNKNKKKNFKLVQAKSAFKNLQSQYEFKKDVNWNGTQQEVFVLPEYKYKKRAKNNSIQKCVKKEKKLNMNDWLEFFGYYISEGCVGKPNTVHLYQNVNTTVFKKMKNVVERLGFSFDIKTRIRKNRTKVHGEIRIQSAQLRSYLKQFGKSFDKFIPKEFLALTIKQLNILLLSLFEGDGSIKNNKLVAYSTASEQLANNVMEIVLKIGKSANIKKYNNQQCNIDGKSYKCLPKHVITVNHTQLTPVFNCGKKTVTQKQLGIQKYNDYVYCCSVPNEIIYVRRNGKGVWCGNCPPYWNLEKYESCPGQLSDTAEYSVFLKRLKQRLRESADLLKVGGFMCMVVGDFRRRGVYIKFHSDLLSEMEDFKDMELHDVICIQNIPFHTAAFYFGSSKRTKRTAKAHEYLLVWRKIK